MINNLIPMMALEEIGRNQEEVKVNKLHGMSGGLILFANLLLLLTISCSAVIPDTGFVPQTKPAIEMGELTATPELVLTEQGPAAPTSQPEPALGEPSTTYLPVVTSDPQRTIFGVQMESVSPGKGLEEMAQAKNSWTRRDFLWRVVEPVEGERNWSAVKYFEDELVTATQNGITMIPIFLDTPDWAMAKDNCRGIVKPEKLPALASFLYDFVERYSGYPYNVKYIEMWNEPDVDNFLGCWGDASDLLYYGGQPYGEMLKMIYPAVKSANPNMQVLVGGLLLDCDPALTFENKTCIPAYFLKGILESGAGNAFDGIAFHTSDYYEGELGKFSHPNFGSAWNTNGPTSTAKAKFLRGQLAEYNVTGKYLIVTEAGIKCGAGEICADSAYGFEETKAYYLVQDGAGALVNGYRANIWYSVYGDRYSGLLDANNQPYPAYYTFTYLRNKLVNHVYVREITAYPGVMGYEFESLTGIKTWVMWSLDGLTHQISLSKAPSSIDKISAGGTALALSPVMNIEVGLAPVFITY